MWLNFADILVLISTPCYLSTTGSQIQPQQVQMRNGIPQQHENAMNGMNGSSAIAIGNGGGGQHQQKVLRENLHYAADSVSNAMSSLVRELNTGAGIH